MAGLVWPDWIGLQESDRVQAPPDDSREALQRSITTAAWRPVEACSARYEKNRSVRQAVQKRARPMLFRPALFSAAALASSISAYHVLYSEGPRVKPSAAPKDSRKRRPTFSPTR